MRISDWSSDVCSSDLSRGTTGYRYNSPGVLTQPTLDPLLTGEFQPMIYRTTALTVGLTIPLHRRVNLRIFDRYQRGSLRSEEHTSELQSLMRISYAVFCLKKKINKITT